MVSWIRVSLVVNLGVARAGASSGRTAQHLSRFGRRLPIDPLGHCPSKISLLDCRQAKPMQRLMARPKGHHGPEKILGRRGFGSLRQIPFIKPEDQSEELKWNTCRSFPWESRGG